ncbi:hypothetical protein DXG03_001656, partial [Asterophora parasitica]
MPYVEGHGPHPDDIIKSMMERLDPMTQECFYALHNCKSKDAKSQRGIIDTNALSIGALPGSNKGAYAAVGISYISRLNH